MIDQEIEGGYLAAHSIELQEVEFIRADSSVAVVSGRVELFVNGSHDVLISSADILRLKLSMEEFYTASDAMSCAAHSVK